MSDMKLVVRDINCDKFLVTARDYFHNFDNGLTVEEREKDFDNFRDKVLDVDSCIFIYIDYDDTHNLKTIYETLQYVEFSTAAVFLSDFGNIRFSESLDFLLFISDFAYNYANVSGEYEFNFIMEYLRENKQLPELGLEVINVNSEYLSDKYEILGEYLAEKDGIEEVLGAIPDSVKNFVKIDYESIGASRVHEYQTTENYLYKEK